MFIAVGREALKIVLPEKFSDKTRVAPGDGYIPGQHDGQIERDSGPPDGAPQERPFAAQGREGKDDAKGKEWRDRAFGEGLRQH